MANQNLHQRTNYYDDANARRYPLPRNRIATIRLLTQGAEAILDETRRYPPSQQDYRDENTQREWRHPRPQPRPSNFIGIFPLLSKILFYGTLSVLLLVLSLGEFGIIYAMAMPGLYCNEVLHFDYTTSGIANEVLGQVSPFRSVQQTSSGGFCSSANGVCNSTTTSMQTNTTRPVFPQHISSLNAVQNYELGQTYQVMMQTAPIAVVDLFSNHDSWEHYHPDIIPQPREEKRVLKQGAPHFIEVVLDLPESKANLDDIGIFSVVVDLHATGSSENSATTTKLLASSTRTARMPHESVWIAVLRKAILILPHLIGAIPERRRITIPSYRFFIESEEVPLRFVKVKLLVSPQKAQDGRMVEVTNGILRIGEELTGMRLVLKEWFFVCATTGTLVLFSMQALFLLLFRLCCFQRNRPSHEEEQEEEECIIFEDDVSGSLGLNGLDGSQHENEYRDSTNYYNDSRAEQRSSHSFDDEEGEWEDLPQNENNTRNTRREEGESRHWIPMN